MHFRISRQISFQGRAAMIKNGFSSIMAMMVLFILSLFLLGLGTAISLTGNYYRKSEAKDQTRRELEREVSRIIEHLKDDPTPQSDSAVDPVQEYIDEEGGKYLYLKLTDVSSRINPNWVRPQFMKKTAFKRFFLSGVTPEDFAEQRNKKGFTLDMEDGYSKVLEVHALKSYFTPYGFANVNTAYEYVLQDLYADLTGDTSGAEVFHTFIARALLEKRIITAKELASAALRQYKTIYPVISTLPQMNVHFIPEFILQQVLSYPYGGKAIKNSSSIVDAVLAERNEREITPEELHTLIPAEKGLQMRIFQYLGTKTWFWKVEIASKHAAAEAVIVCFPSRKGVSGTPDSSTDFNYRLYSFRFTN